MAMTKTAMKVPDVIALLEENQNERGIANWEKRERDAARLKSYGIGLTVLRKLAKKIGRDRELAQELWKTDIYDAKIIGLLIDDPNLITREQAESQVEDLGEGLLEHVFASCDATLAKAPFAFDLADEWMGSPDEMRRRCGYGLLYELSKKNPKGMDDDYLLDRIAHIRAEIDGEETQVRAAMGGALLGIGKRNKMLNQAVLDAAEQFGPISYGDDNNCEPLNLVKHMTSDYLKKKLGV